MTQWQPAPASSGILCEKDEIYWYRSSGRVNALAQAMWAP
jgi:hypothetical protein